MLSEHAVVYAKDKINEMINKGCIGVIVNVCDADTYLVEFFDSNMRTIDLCFVSKDQIEVVSNEME